MNTNDDPRGKLAAGQHSSTMEVEKFKKIIQDMQMEIDILKETLDDLKKDPGVDMTALNNHEKAVIVDALKRKYSLPFLLQKLHLPRSSYYYHHREDALLDKYVEIRQRIIELFNENFGRYGYRRIHALLIKEGRHISEKIVCRIMQECALIVKTKRKNKRYSSYKGEITPSVPNVISRDFYSNLPNQKCLTDITEFAIPAGKVFLSQVVDCFDGLIPAWNIGITPDATLVNTMLDDAIGMLSKNERPLVHTDRGCHYR